MENILKTNIKQTFGDDPTPERLIRIRTSDYSPERYGIITVSGFNNRHKNHSAKVQKEKENLFPP